MVLRERLYRATSGYVRSTLTWIHLPVDGANGTAGRHLTLAARLEVERGAGLGQPLLNDPLVEIVLGPRVHRQVGTGEELRHVFHVVRARALADGRCALALSNHGPFTTSRHRSTNDLFTTFYGQ